MEDRSTSGFLLPTTTAAAALMTSKNAPGGVVLFQAPDRLGLALRACLSGFNWRHLGLASG